MCYPSYESMSVRRHIGDGLQQVEGLPVRSVQTLNGPVPVGGGLLLCEDGTKKCYDPNAGCLHGEGKCEGGMVGERTRAP